MRTKTLSHSHSSSFIHFSIFFTMEPKSVNPTRRPQREAKKKAVAALCEQQRKRKRVPLGEITNDVNTNANANANDVVLPTQKKRNVSTSSNSDGTPVPEKLEKFEDPQLCETYVSDIYDYLRNMEVDSSKRPLCDYIQKVQRDVNASMRGVLVDWLVEVAEEYKLVSDTLYFSVSYIDRFLSLNDLTRQKLQLLGVASMLVAS